MRRLLFLFSCGVALWVAVGARHALHEQQPSPADDSSVMTLADRSHVVSQQFGLALQQAGVRVRRVNHALGRAASGLNSIAGN